MTNSLEHLPRRDIERLSAYLDGELSPEETQELEARLGGELTLRKSLAELKATVKLLRAVPQVGAPRNYTLTPEMAGQRQGWRAYPALQMATALAALAFVVVLGFDALSVGRAPQGILSRSMEVEAPLQLAQPAGDAAPAEEEVPQLEEAAGLAEGEGMVEERATKGEEPQLFAGAADQVEADERAMATEGTEVAAEMLESEGSIEEPAAPATTAPTVTELAATPTAARTATPVPTATREPTVTAVPPAGAVVPHEQPAARSIGVSRSLLRLTEVVLAALVIVLAAVTYRLRPRRP